MITINKKNGRYFVIGQKGILILFLILLASGCGGNEPTYGTNTPNTTNAREGALQNTTSAPAANRVMPEEKTQTQYTTNRVEPTAGEKDSSNTPATNSAKPPLNAMTNSTK